jgi:hypothetical protein
MYKYKNLLLPPIFNNLYTENCATHRYPTRIANQLRIPRVKTKLADNFITKTGVHIWNKLGHELDSISRLGTFKYKLKASLCGKY